MVAQFVTVQRCAEALRAVLLVGAIVLTVVEPWRLS